MSRVVLLSGAVPYNTNSRFKLCLPTPLSLTDGYWEVGLLSLSMADAGVAPHYLVQTMMFSMDDLLETFCITSGLELMKAILEVVYWKQNYELQ